MTDYFRAIPTERHPRASEARPGDPVLHNPHCFGVKRPKADYYTGSPDLRALRLPEDDVRGQQTRPLHVTPKVLNYI